MNKKTKKHHNTVASDFTISLTDTEQANPAAADMLRLCAFLFPENIPEDILKEGIKALDGNFEDIVEDAAAWEEALREACNTGFLRHDPSRKRMTMNSTIQNFLRQGMSESELREWAEKAVLAVDKAFPEVEFSNWSDCQRLLRCAQTGTDWIIKLDLVFEKAAHLLSATASFLHERGKYAHSRPLYERALAIRKQLLGEEHPEVAESINDLASLYHIQGKYAQAKQLYNRALEIVEMILSKDEQSDTKKLQTKLATSFNNLGSLHKAQGLFEDAKPYYEKALDIWENVLQEENSYLAATLNNLGGLYEKQGEYEQAKSLYERAMKIWEEKVDNDHPNISATINNLGGLYKVMGEDEKVQPLLKQALAIRENALGDDHPDVAISLNNLAELYKIEGEYAQAKPMYERALKILKETFDSNHPHVLMCKLNYNNLLYLTKKPRKKRRVKRRK